MKIYTGKKIQVISTNELKKFQNSPKTLCRVQLILFQRTGSAPCPQLAKASSQVSRPDVWRAACCERPSWFTYLCACHQPNLKLRHNGLHYWDVKFPKF